MMDRKLRYTAMQFQNTRRHKGNSVAIIGVKQHRNIQLNLFQIKFYNGGDNTLAEHYLKQISFLQQQQPIL
jgi:hypothetical protein